MMGLTSIEKRIAFFVNVLILIGMIIPGVLYIYNGVGSDVEVYVDAFSFDKNSLLISPTSSSGEELIIGDIGTLSKVFIHNKSNNSVFLEVRTPKAKDFTNNGLEGFFTNISAIPRCHIMKDELKLNNNGLILKDDVGYFELSKFPPDCTLELVIASTLSDSGYRFRNWEIEVFYDGKRANVYPAYKFYGALASYFGSVIYYGFWGYIFMIILPIVTVFSLLVYITIWIQKKRSNV